MLFMKINVYLYQLDDKVFENSKDILLENSRIILAE